MSKLLFQPRINFWWKHPKTLISHDLRMSHQNLKKNSGIHIDRKRNKLCKNEEFLKKSLFHTARFLQKMALKKNLFSCFLEMPAFGVELMTVSIFINMKFSKLTEIWHRGTLLYVYYNFNVYFFKVFVTHVFWANLVLNLDFFKLT